MTNYFGIRVESMNFVSIRSSRRFYSVHAKTRRFIAYDCVYTLLKPISGFTRNPFKKLSDRTVLKRTKCESDERKQKYIIQVYSKCVFHFVGAIIGTILLLVVFNNIHVLSLRFFFRFRSAAPQATHDWPLSELTVQHCFACIIIFFFAIGYYNDVPPRTNDTLHVAIYH